MKLLQLKIVWFLWILPRCLSNKCKYRLAILVLKFSMNRVGCTTWNSFLYFYFHVGSVLSQTWVFQKIYIHLKCLHKTVQQHWKPVHYQNLTKYILKHFQYFFQHIWWILVLIYQGILLVLFYGLNNPIVKSNVVI